MKSIQYLALSWLSAVLIQLWCTLPINAQNIDPSNTAYLIRLNDTLYADIAEVSIARWHEFSDLVTGSHQPSKEIINTKAYSYLFQPPAGVVLKPFALEGEFNKLRLLVQADSIVTGDQKSAMRKLLNYPVVGITYEQAKSFCKWRTKVHNDKLYGITDSTQYRVRYDLPEPWMYELMLTSIDSFDRCATFNYRCEACADDKKKKKDIDEAIGKDLMAINTFWLDERNMYHTRGNVGEMTNKKGLAKGGSYHHFARAAHPKAIQYYKKPEPWLGFRCIAVVLVPAEAKDYDIFLKE